MTEKEKEGAGMRDVTYVTYGGETFMVVSPYEKVDESQLSIVDRLGLAYCRLNCYEWDEMLGEPPCTITHEVSYKKMMAIQEIIGDANTSRCWWKFNLGKSEEEWKSWYYEKYPADQTSCQFSNSGQSGDGEKRRGNKLKNLPMLIRSLFLKK